MTALRLAEELEVSVRTVCRDAAAFGSAGIPLHGDAGHAGGYRLVDGCRRSEAQAAFSLHSPAPLPSSASARCSPPPGYRGHPLRGSCEGTPSDPGDLCGDGPFRVRHRRLSAGSRLCRAVGGFLGRGPGGEEAQSLLGG
ncbi:HTH domain-containing protein [Streptomyces sp. NBC_01460]|uniref:HTH domain-containing protein n=1 Tax=Streptomyces sp. NBC_01460 TaxID=2903875 RepID=UPI003FCDFBDC